MKTFLYRVCITFTLLCHADFLQAQVTKTANKSRPNIIVIMADDMGYSDIGCYGGEIATPNLDKLAKNGIQFTQFYNAARCCPSRASLLTGQYPHKAGIGGMVDSKNLPYAGYLLPSALTTAEALQQAGYFTAMSGKWHVGEDSLHWPLQRGFDKYYGLISGASSYYELDSGRTFLDGNRRIRPGDNFYATHAYTDKALGYIEEGVKADKPFFLYLAYTAPHWPLHAPEEAIQPYQGKYMAGWDQLRKNRYQTMVKQKIISPQWKLSERDTAVAPWENEPEKAHWDRRMAVYAAMITIMDEGIGKIIKKLQEAKQLDNTVIFFLADNGGSHEIPHVYYRKLKYMTEEQLRGKPGNYTSYVGYEKRWAHASNTPFTRYKSYIHEGGIASPLIVHWPQQIKQHALKNDVTHIIDIMPTCLDIAHVPYPATYHNNTLKPLDGQSLLPLLTGKSWKGHDLLIWEHFGNKGIRQGKWKLVAEKDQPWELYDMEADRTENNNLAATYPEKVKELEERYLKRAEKAGVVLSQ